MLRGFQLLIYLILYCNVTQLMIWMQNASRRLLGTKETPYTSSAPFHSWTKWRQPTMCIYCVVVIISVTEIKITSNPPVTEQSLTAVLQSSILAECQGTYLSWVEPARSTCLNMCRLDLSDSWYMNVFRMSAVSFKASWCNDPDFFHFCMNHMPEKWKCKWIQAQFHLKCFTKLIGKIWV